MERPGRRNKTALNRFFSGAWATLLTFHIYQFCPGAGPHPHPQGVGNALLPRPDPYERIFRKYFLCNRLSWSLSMVQALGSNTHSLGLPALSFLTLSLASFLSDESREHIQALTEEEAFWGKGRQPANSSWRTVCGNSIFNIHCWP